MPQRPWLMPATVRDNVRLGRPDAGDAEVWAALEQVRLAHHVASLPDGLDTVLAEDGAPSAPANGPGSRWPAWSSSDRPWVLLDEPTAHLDAETEAVVADTLVRLAADRAVVVVAHRPRWSRWPTTSWRCPPPPPVDPRRPGAGRSVRRATTPAGRRPREPSGRAATRASDPASAGCCSAPCSAPSPAPPGWRSPPPRAG